MTNEKLPTRVFPAAALSQDVPAGQQLSLTYDHDSSRLAGSLGVQTLEWDLERHGHTARGRIGELRFEADWTRGNNYVPRPGGRMPTPDYVSDFPNIPADLAGSFAGVDVELHGVFHLDPGYRFERGVILGRIGAVHLEATVLAASGGLSDSRTVAVEGTYGTVPFEVYATIDAGMSKGLVRGSVGEATVHLDLTRPPLPHPRAPMGYPGPTVQIAGSYSGPPELLAIIVGSLLRFA
jgi:hypothetical protein